VQRKLLVSIYSKIMSYQCRSDLYMKARGFGLCIESIGSIGSGRIWAYRDIDVCHRSWGLFQYIPRTSVIVIQASGTLMLDVYFPSFTNTCIIAAENMPASNRFTYYS
jgi:hypothetical protein